jgi:phospholipid N-methyltransferase
LIAGLPQYRDSVLALLDKLSFNGAATAIEVGPGDGVFCRTWRRFTRSPRWTTARRCSNWRAM